jgi:hypothetical protein
VVDEWRALVKTVED